MAAYGIPISVNGTPTVEKLVAAVEEARMLQFNREPTAIRVGQRDLGNLPSKVDDIPVKSCYVKEGTVEIEFLH